MIPQYVLHRLQNLTCYSYCARMYRKVSPDQLDASKYDVYAAYAASNDHYSWDDDEVNTVLKWVGEEGKGLLLVGVIDWADSAKEIIEEASVNKYVDGSHRYSFS